MAMRMNNIRMKTTVKREELLRIIKENYEQHKKIVAEAQASYRTKAVEALDKVRQSLIAGKNAKLVFNLKVPEDYSEVYRNSIEMLEWNTNEFVELEADEFRQLVRDEWDWTEAFLVANSWLSKTAGGALIQKGYNRD